MIRVSASAPGKIVLCGEYVVLDGTPALAVAVNRRAAVTICENQARYHSVTSPGYTDEKFFFKVDEQFKFEGAASVPDFSLIEQIWRAFLPDPSLCFDLVLDTKSFSDPTLGGKLGLGSSAALTVALSAAMAELQQRVAGLDAMIESHRQFQSGRGSGIDIAAARYGGVIEYCRGESVIVQRRAFPRGLKYAILWSGTAVNTAQQLERLGAIAKHSDSHDSLAAASKKIVAAWSEAEATKIVALFEDYTAALGVFSGAHGLGIFEAGHHELVKVAAKHGAVYKPCGAGGGDVGIVLSTNSESIDTFVAEASTKGFMPLDLNIDDVGLTVGKQE